MLPIFGWPLKAKPDTQSSEYGVSRFVLRNAQGNRRPSIRTSSLSGRMLIPIFWSSNKLGLSPPNNRNGCNLCPPDSLSCSMQFRNYCGLIKLHRNYGCGRHQL
jgi:hypothetical protein